MRPSPSLEDRTAGITIRVEGRFGRPGKIEFALAGQPVGSVVLPRMQFAVAAILAKVAKKAPANSPHAYLSYGELAEQLAIQGVTKTANPQSAVKTVQRLRETISDHDIADLYWVDAENANDFAYALIERDAQLGYRINIHPENLLLEIATL